MDINTNRLLVGAMLGGLMMTDEQKAKSYTDYLESRKPFDEPVLTYEQFVESITADD